MNNLLLGMQLKGTRNKKEMERTNLQNEKEVVMT